MVSAAGVADCAQGDGTYVRQKNMPGNILVAERKSWNGNRECAYFINGRLISSIRELN